MPSVWIPVTYRKFRIFRSKEIRHKKHFDIIERENQVVIEFKDDLKVLPNDEMVITNLVHLGFDIKNARC